MNQTASPGPSSTSWSYGPTRTRPLTQKISSSVCGRWPSVAWSVPRGTDQATGAHLPGTEEVIFCVKGRVRVGPYEQEVELGPGDAVWFTADVPHHYEALRDTRTLCFMIYPVAGP